NGLSESDDFSSGTSSRKFLVPLVILQSHGDKRVRLCANMSSMAHIINTDKLVGAIFYYNAQIVILVTHIPLLWSCPPAAGQHNDARMNLAIALTAARYGAAIANYTEVVHLLKRADPQTGKERVCSAHCRDVITGQEFDVRAKCVINATGPFTDALQKMDDQKNPDICQPSAGVHIVILGVPGSCYLPIHLRKDAQHPHTTRINPLEQSINFILTEVNNYPGSSSQNTEGDYHTDIHAFIWPGTPHRCALILQVKSHNCCFELKIHHL
uniref:glycerol-3-phosphate dehydrogenase n=1 Tax=Anabas testudineus TaxID=64144 RepID=A0A7N6APX7_ANATE